MQDVLKKGRPKGSVNKICEYSLAIFEHYKDTYKWVPLVTAIELVRRLEDECKALPLLSDNIPLVKELGSQLSTNVMPYAYSKFKAIEVNIGEQESSYLTLLCKSLGKDKENAKK